MQNVRHAAILAIVVTSQVHGAGFVHNANFVVFTPSAPNREAGQRFAELVLSRAEKFRSQIAEDWLGRELLPSVGRTIINVELSETEDRGLTWAKDRPDRRFHTVYLTTSAENAVGGTLAHEIAHTVLATCYPHPNRLPPWLEEGIASRYDDEVSLASREQVIRSWLRAGRMPRLDRILRADRIHSGDDRAYAAATSLVEFLLVHGDRQALLEFARAGTTDGWSEALEQHYGIRSISQLQAGWESWLEASR